MMVGQGVKLAGAETGCVEFAEAAGTRWRNANGYFDRAERPSAVRR